MTKRYLLIILAFCFISVGFMISCANKNQVNNTTKSIEQNNPFFVKLLNRLEKFHNPIRKSNLYIVETKNYAIYPINIIENSPAEFNEYTYRKRDISINFPQIYYSNKYKKDLWKEQREIETQINKILFDLSCSQRLLVERDNRNTDIFYSTYTITHVEENLVSIKYYGYFKALNHNYNFCRGVTLNTDTGEIAKISDYISIDEDLIIKIKDGSIKYSSPRGYDEDAVIFFATKFVELYKEYSNENPNFYKNSFYIEENSLRLIIQDTRRNGNYIILEIPR